MKCHSCCSAADANANASANASTAAGGSLRAGTAMTAVTHLVTCREQRRPLQAYLEREKPIVNMISIIVVVVIVFLSQFGSGTQTEAS